MRSPFEPRLMTVTTRDRELAEWLAGMTYVKLGSRTFLVERWHFSVDLVIHLREVNLVKEENKPMERKHDATADEASGAGGPGSAGPDGVRPRGDSVVLGPLPAAGRKPGEVRPEVEEVAGPDLGRAGRRAAQRRKLLAAMDGRVCAPLLSASTPYRSIADYYDVPYGVILTYADALDLLDGAPDLADWLALLNPHHRAAINALGGHEEAARETAALRYRLAVRP